MRSVPTTTAPLPFAFASRSTRRFWNERTSALFDVVDGDDGDDDAIRPNQLFAISLPYPVLNVCRWKAVVDVVYDHCSLHTGCVHSRRAILTTNHNISVICARGILPITRGPSGRG